MAMFFTVLLVGVGLLIYIPIYQQNRRIRLDDELRQLEEVQQRNTKEAELRGNSAPDHPLR